MTTSETSKPLYFWRETVLETGWMSQWHAGWFSDDEDTSKRYRTAEHYMMHHKALLFGDHKIADAILKAGHPREVKRLGRKVSNFSEQRWLEERENIVRRANVLKFTRPVEDKDKDLLAKLLATGDRELVEASPYDRIWGIGFVEKNADEVRDEWGLNLLGKVLMEVRESLKTQQASA